MLSSNIRIRSNQMTGLLGPSLQQPRTPAMNSKKNEQRRGAASSPVCRNKEAVHMLELCERTIPLSLLTQLRILLTQQDVAAEPLLAELDRQFPLQETLSYFHGWQALNARQWKQAETHLGALSHACAFEEGMLT